MVSMGGQLESNEGQHIEEALRLAESLLRSSARTETRAERRKRQRMARLLGDEAGKRFVLVLTDQVVRFHDRRRAARRFRHLIATEGAPAFAGTVDRWALAAGATLAPIFPDLVMPLVTKRLRHESNGVILDAGERSFTRHVARRRGEGVRLNVNVLGEAVLGEAEALRRRDAVLARLARDDVDYVSVKISAVCSQLNVLAFDYEVERIAERLRPLYEEARRHSPAKFVNLDMEEYRDLHLTAAVFRRLLGESAFVDLDAGIVLQAYLPDSLAVAQDLCEWAQQRRMQGGGRVKVRLVKGANLAMEAVEAELRGWAQAPYDTKADVDANYKRILEVLLDEQYADSVRVGLATHNVFDVAWGLVLASASGAQGRLDVEMLEGMAPSQARSVSKASGGVLLYAPVVGRDDFEAAIAYLVRRLDENTAPENFLRAAFAMEVGSPTFLDQRDRFVASVHRRHEVLAEPRRRQDRRMACAEGSVSHFSNEPDTDFSLPGNRTWIADHLARLDQLVPDSVPAVVDGEVIAPDEAPAVRPAYEAYAEGGHILLTSPRHALADIDLVERAVAASRRAGKEWAARPMAERRRVLRQVADVMAARRGETLAVMALEAGKTVLEGDPEVSEACDFARYYADSTRTLEALASDGVQADPLGTVVVASPWNFPYAIPAGGVLASLAAGNAVILKPAPEAVATGWLVASHCWEAGVPRDVLQFLPCPDDEVGKRLVTHHNVDAVVLTGSYETARLFLGWKPDMRLLAETSGKNALVVTAAADVDAAVKDLVQSAFGHAGQKCSAASLAIVERAVYDDPAFRRQLADAVTTLVVGRATDLRTNVGPLIRPPGDRLRAALTSLDEGEEWLVAPRRLDEAGHLWSPGVKLGVRPGSSFHRTECFGPVLGVMRADNLEQALEWQNSTAFGLTGGLHSLDEQEVEAWKAGVEVGNAYVNRGTTGAVVRRQPFGGWKRSVVGGAAAKAGGPNYVLALTRLTSHEACSVAAAHASFGRWWRQEFAVEHDPSGLRAERNVFRYRGLPEGVLVRAGNGVEDREVDIALCAARVAGVRVDLSTAIARDLEMPAVVTVESDDDLAGRMSGVVADRIRLLGDVDAGVRRAAHEAGLPVDESPVVGHGRVELLRWVREQSISETRHRHGNLLDE